MMDSIYFKYFCSVCVLVLIICTVQKAMSSHLALLLTATGNYQCFILTGFDVLKQGCSRTTVSKAQH